MFKIGIWVPARHRPALPNDENINIQMQGLYKSRNRHLLRLICMIIRENVIMDSVDIMFLESSGKNNTIKRLNNFGFISSNVYQAFAEGFIVNLSTCFRLATTTS